MTVRETLTKIYQSPDLRGEALIAPLKKWDRLVNSKITAGSTVWRAGYIAHLVLGILAGIGMLVKWTDISRLKNDHKEQIRRVTAVHNLLGGFRASENDLYLDGVYASSGNFRVLGEFPLRKSYLDADRAQIMNFINGCYRNFYILNSTATWEGKERTDATRSSITVRIFVDAASDLAINTQDQ